MLGWVVLSLLLLAGQGCSSAAKKASLPPQKTTPSTVSPPEASDKDLSPAAKERAQAYAHFAMGLILDLKQQSNEALEEYQKSVLLDPSNESLALDLARQYLQRKQPEKAAEVLTVPAASPEASADTLAWLGVANHQLNKIDKASDLARQALKKDPEQLLALQTLVQIHFQNNQSRQALQLLEDATRQTSENPGYYVDLAEVLNHFSSLAGKEGADLRKRAGELLAKAESLKPEEPGVQQRIADLYITNGAPEKAVSIYVELLKQYPNLPAIRERLADLYLRGNDTEKAREILESMVRQNGTNPQAHYLLGVIASEAKDYKKAAGYFEKTIMLNPAFEPAWYDLAGMQIAADQAQSALATLERLRTATPQSYLLEFYSALAHSRLKNYPEALKYLVRAEIIANATETNRLNHVLYFQLGAVYERNKDYAQAEKYFGKCLEENPEDTETLNYLGYMWAERGVNLDESLRMIEKAVKLEPDNAAFLDSLAWVLYKLNRPAEALPHILKALEHTKEADATLYDHLGDIHHVLGHSEQAREAWKKSLEIESSDEIRRKLEAN